MSTNKNTVVVFEGPSTIDGEPIVVLLSGLADSKNTKTGNMLQTYILRADISTTEAVKAGGDASICGDCPHRGPTGDGKGRSCYVKHFQAPLSMYRAYKAGSYETVTLADAADRIHGGKLRIGSYGDPGAVPGEVWETLSAAADMVTGYTHQWRTRPHLASTTMASADSLGDAREAWAKGWRTFRVTSDLADKQPNEVVCPASEEAGKKLTCAQCRACDGNCRGLKSSIVIKVHGGKGKGNQFKNIAIATA